MDINDDKSAECISFSECVGWEEKHTCTHTVHNGRSQVQKTNQERGKLANHPKVSHKCLRHETQSISFFGAYT